MGRESANSLYGSKGEAYCTVSLKFLCGGGGGGGDSLALWFVLNVNQVFETVVLDFPLNYVVITSCDFEMAILHYTAPLGGGGWYSL